jgi:hypothetical protein
VIVRRTARTGAPAGEQDLAEAGVMEQQPTVGLSGDADRADHGELGGVARRTSEEQALVIVAHEIQ